MKLESYVSLLVGSQLGLGGGNDQPAKAPVHGGGINYSNTNFWHYLHEIFWLFKISNLKNFLVICIG